MKLPSIFRTASHARFEIKPRHYDPIKEDIEDRTSRIRQELIRDGQLSDAEIEEGVEKRRGLGTGIRGSFAHRGMKPKKASMISTSSIIRTILFFCMIIGVFGYIYVGPEIFYYLVFGAIGIAGGYYLLRFLKKTKDE
jgi:hypothetical protein